MSLYNVCAGEGSGKGREERKSKKDSKDKKTVKMAEEAERMEDFEKTKKLLVEATAEMGARTQQGTQGAAEGDAPVPVRQAKGKALRSSNPVVAPAAVDAAVCEDQEGEEEEEDREGVGGGGEASKKKKRKKKKKSSGGAAGSEAAPAGERHVAISPESVQAVPPAKIQRQQTGIPAVAGEKHVAFDEAAPAAGAEAKGLRRKPTGVPAARTGEEDSDEDVAPTGPVASSASLPPSRHMQGCTSAGAFPPSGRDASGGMLGLGIAAVVAVGLGIWFAARRRAA